MKQVLFIIILLTISFFAMPQNNQKPTESFGITASLPWVNNYCYYDHELKRSSSKSGFSGLGAGAFYKKEKNIIALNTGLTADLPAPIGAFDYAKEGTRTNILSIFAEGLYYKKLFGKLNIIAGINYVSYRFNFTSYIDTLPSYSVFDRTVGITTGTEYYFSKTFSVALFYRPAIVSLDLKQYRHLVSLDARFNITVWRKS
jgi:hypothetical protein